MNTDIEMLEERYRSTVRNLSLDQINFVESDAPTRSPIILKAREHYNRLMQALRESGRCVRTQSAA